MATALLRSGDKPLLHVALFLATLLTTFGTFFVFFGGGIWGAWMFSVALLAILLAHEMGHYLYARHHDVDSSLPYFIPMPLLGVGTLGAVIRIRGRIPHRNALVDIGAAGPLAGLLVAIPVLFIGLLHSEVVAAPDVPTRFPGETSLWALALAVMDHFQPSAAYVEPASSGLALSFGDNLLILALQRMVLGTIPKGMVAQAHPLVIAGWFGTLVTMLNLMPIGQLDGGHLTHALFGERAARIGKVMAVALLLLCVFVTASWFIWLVVTSKFIGFRHPEVQRPEEPLSPRRKWICALCLLAFVACAIPVPMTQVAVP